MGILMSESFFAEVEDVFGDTGALLLFACKPNDDEVDWELLHAATFISSFSSAEIQSIYEQINSRMSLNCGTNVPQSLFTKLFTKYQEKTYRHRLSRHHSVLVVDGRINQV